MSRDMSVWTTTITVTGTAAPGDPWDNKAPDRPTDLAPLRADVADTVDVLIANDPRKKR